MRLDDVARARRRCDRPAEHDVIREHDVGRQALAQRRRVQLDIAVALRRRQFRKQPCFEPFVAIEHEHGQDAADLRTDQLRGAGVVQLGMAFLAEQHDVVPGTAPFARERARVDVRARPAQ